jgi:NAD-dependent deacetylase
MTASEEQAALEEVGERLKDARRVLAITGAGVSAESGVPTFRGEEGMYKGRDPMQLASPASFADDPAMVWEWYQWRQSIVGKAEPNAAHRALAAWEERFDDMLLLTQNIDGLHQKAGSQQVHELHGNIWRCKTTDTLEIVPENEIVNDAETRLPHTKAGELLRPDVVWFGEMLPTEPFRAWATFLAKGKADACFVIGTSALLPYVVQLALEAQNAGAILIEINPEETNFSRFANYTFRQLAGEILPRLDSLF